MTNSHTKFLKFIPTAQMAMTYSKDPSTQVGAIAIDDDYNIRAQAYNGFPRGVHDTKERLNDRAQKYPRIVHAEANLVAMAARTGVSLKDCSVILTSLHPCSSCAGLLIQAGIKRIFAPQSKGNSRWDESSALAMEMFQEAGVEMLEYDEERKVVGLDVSSIDSITVKSGWLGDSLRYLKMSEELEVVEKIKPFMETMQGLEFKLPETRPEFKALIEESLEERVRKFWEDSSKLTETKHNPTFMSEDEDA